MPNGLVTTCRVRRSVVVVAEVVLAADDVGVEVALGDVLVVRLEETATTGFLWRAETDGGLVEVDGASEPGGPAPGAAGERVLRLRADEVGTWRLDLRLGRPWEDAVAQERRVDVTVR